jgi:hypothetical protein
MLQLITDIRVSSKDEDKQMLQDKHMSKIVTADYIYEYNPRTRTSICPLVQIVTGLAYVQIVTGLANVQNITTDEVGSISQQSFSC